MDINTIYKEQQDIKASLNRILQILQSDPSINAEGLVEKANRIDKEVQSIKTERAIEKAKLSLIGAAAGIIGSLIYPLIQKLFQ